MQFTTTDLAATAAETDCLIVGHHADSLTGVVQDIDQASSGLITRLHESGDLPDAVGKTIVLHAVPGIKAERSEEHTSELQSRGHLVCRLLLEKKKTR